MEDFEGDEGGKPVGSDGAREGGEKEDGGEGKGAVCI